jgi:large subunit ribosomal protein L34e
MINRRVHYTRKVSFRTRSNAIKRIRTPGNRLTIQYTAKKSHGVVGEKGQRLAGIPAERPAVFRRMNKRSRTVSRAYGGTKSHDEVRNRIVRAFLVEEVKLIKKLSGSKEKASKGGDKKKSKSKSGKKKN